MIRGPVRQFSLETAQVRSFSFLLRVLHAPRVKATLVPPTLDPINSLCDSRRNYVVQATSSIRTAGVLADAADSRFERHDLQRAAHSTRSLTADFDEFAFSRRCCPYWREFANQRARHRQRRFASRRYCERPHFFERART